ncbi:MAG TPA: GSCFA domain-containing protein [Puia sp.]|nr:GSCFA domain-containing protein [Puia sp.]
MKFMLDLAIDTPAQKINYNDPIMLIGSCFTEHIGDGLNRLKFNILQNPNGILFDPESVSASLISYIKNKVYKIEDLICVNELWHSWNHHSVFSHTNIETCLHQINRSMAHAADYLGKARWLIITLGSSFSYQLRQSGKAVANCHRAPAQWFNKHLLSVEEIQAKLDNCIHQLFHFNPSLNIVLTISPVRHIRDGVTENNRSKARLIESVHNLCAKFGHIYYFPAYEIVIDVLRDYRFFDVDMVHPNYQCTQYVFQEFLKNFIDEDSQRVAAEVTEIVAAMNHTPSNPETEAHKKFLKTFHHKVARLSEKYNFLEFKRELEYFGGT